MGRKYWRRNIGYWDIGFSLKNPLSNAALRLGALRSCVRGQKRGTRGTGSRLVRNWPSNE